MRFARSRVLIVLITVAAFACTNSSSGTTPSGARPATPSPAAANPADTKAADLRALLDLLFGEHVMVIAKASLAANANRSDEYKGYATLVNINRTDLGGVMTSAFGASAAATFDQMWAAQNNYFVDYTVGLVAHDDHKTTSAQNSLVATFVPQFAQFMNSTTSIPTDPITQLALKHAYEVMLIIKDQADLNNAQMFKDLHTAYVDASRMGDALASAIARKFPDKFPGDPASKAVDFRVSLDTLLQEHSYLATMTTSATAAGRGSEQAAALNALAANADTLGTLFSQVFGTPIGTRFDQVWGARDAELVVYAGNADPASRQNALRDLTGTFVTQFSSLIHDSADLPEDEISTPVAGQVTDTVKVIDDQKAKAASVIAADDRSAAAATNPIGDLIATATVAKLPQKF